MCDTNLQDTPFPAKNCPFPRERQQSPSAAPRGCTHPSFLQPSLRQTLKLPPAGLRTTKFPTGTKMPPKAKVAKEKNPSWPPPVLSWHCQARLWGLAEGV